jgi:hypothetical protein
LAVRRIFWGLRYDDPFEELIFFDSCEKYKSRLSQGTDQGFGFQELAEVLDYESEAKVVKGYFWTEFWDRWTGTKAAYREVRDIVAIRSCRVIW